MGSWDDYKIEPAFGGLTDLQQRRDKRELIRDNAVRLPETVDQQKAKQELEKARMILKECRALLAKSEDLLKKIRGDE